MGGIPDGLYDISAAGPDSRDGHGAAAPRLEDKTLKMHIETTKKVNGPEAKWPQ